MFYSQFGEDRILAELFQGKTDGTCVEVGANDGVTGSTTLHFEQLGWRCVLIEPNPALVEQLRRQRGAQIFAYAASSSEGVATLQIAEGAELSHGVSTIEPEDRALAKLREYGFSARPVTVEKKPLDSILAEAQLGSDLDFMSIDVEGHELEVLEGFSIERWQPRFLIVEDNSNFADASVRRHLAKSGYIPFLRTGVNDWYARRSDSSITALRRARYLGSRVNGRTRSLLRRIPGLRSLHRRLRRSQS